MADGESDKMIEPVWHQRRSHPCQRCPPIVAHEVRALDTVRKHIKTTIAEANLGKELSESSLDSRLAALRNQTGDVQARKQLAELKAKKAASQQQGGQKTM